MHAGIRDVQGIEQRRAEMNQAPMSDDRFDEIEHDVRLKLLQAVTGGLQIQRQRHGRHVMPHAAQRLGNRVDLRKRV